MEKPRTTLPEAFGGIKDKVMGRAILTTWFLRHSPFLSLIIISSFVNSFVRIFTSPVHTEPSLFFLKMEADL